MTSRLKRTLIPFVLAAVTAMIYLPQLGTAPPHLMPDEVVVAVDAHAIATTGRDFFHGRLLPLYFEFNRLVVGHNGGRDIRVSWLPPGIFYAVALVLKVLPFSETAVRLPTAIVAIIDVLLICFVGRRLFGDERLAVLSAALLALTPAHFIHSRMAADYLFPLPFMLGWVLCLLNYLPTRREAHLFAGTLCLGIGLYSYAASTLVMPIYLLVTAIVLMMERRPARSYLVAAAGFLLPAALCIPWLVVHPTMIAEVLKKYELNGGGNMTALQSLRSLFTYHRIGDEFGLYWGFFNPRFLFFDGPMEPMYSTRQVGVFLLPVAPLLCAGLYATIRAKVTSITVLLWLGFLTAPIAATVVTIPDAIYRALEMLPFVALLAAWGTRELWVASSLPPRRTVFFVTGVVLLAAGTLYATRIAMTQSRMPGGAGPMMALGALAIVLGVFANRLRLGQIVVLGLLALVPIQFAQFYADYFTDYRARVTIAFSGNIRGAYEEVLKEDQQLHPPAIYLGEIGSYSFGGLYWQFYLIKHGRLDLVARTIDGYLFYPDRVLQLPPRSLIVTNAGDGSADLVIDRLVAAGELKKNAVITEPDGTPTYLVLQRVAPGD
jgi:4-amino-4-deoxy-L-arabinose transferase-like glycosyltransferase